MFVRWPLKFMMKLATLIVAAAAIYFMVSAVQVVLASKVPSGTKGLTAASTIVITGSSVDQNAPSGDLLARLQEGLACYQAHLSSSLTVTGTAATGEAGVETSWLEENGVPKSAIDPVTGSDTASQLQAAATALHTGREVIIVTDAMDTLWVRDVAIRDGLKPEIAPGLGSERPFYDQLGTVLSQAGAVAVGRIIGFSRASWG
jgi:hypothetical protein